MEKKIIYYISGTNNPRENNVEFFKFFDYIKENEVKVEFEWSGDYILNTYYLNNGEIWVISSNSEYGTFSYIERIKSNV